MSVVNINGATTKAMYLVPGYIKHVSSTDGTEVVPSGECWEVLNARAVITTTATAGNRTFALRVLTPDSGIAYSAAATANLAASQSNAVRETTLSSPYFAGPGSTVAFIDTANIDAADTKAIVFTVRVQPIPH